MLYAQISCDMDGSDRQRLDELRMQVNCAKNFACVSSKFKNLCRAKYQCENKELECLDDGPDICDFVVYKQNIKLCSCELRIYIEQNLDKWIEKSNAY